MAPRATKKSASADVVVVPETPVDETPVSQPPPATAPVAQTPESVSTSDEVSETSTDSFVVLGDKLSMVISELKNLVTVVKTLQKEHNKLKKLSSKKGKNRKSDGAPRVQSGFAKPTKLSDALCTFLAIPKGSELARTEVTRKINEYIKQNDLQSKEDRRIIVPDANLKSILDLKEGVSLSFFNLQGCLKNHFLKV